MKCIEIDPEKIDKSLKEIESFSVDLDENLKFKIMLICEEVITNQIRHADFEDKIADIKFCFEIKNETTLLFKDNAKKFNPLKKEDPDTTKSLEETALGGLGIFMVKKYSKNIDYKYINGYNILKVTL